MRSKIITAFSFLLLGTLLNAQSFSWAFSIAGPSSSSVESVTTDSQGNVYSTGHFSGAVDFDPGQGTLILTSAGGIDVFVSKVDSLNNLIWAIGMGGPDSDAGDALAIDASGNVYVTGSYRGIADFDPGSGVYSLYSNGSNDVYAVKLTSSGTLTWAKSMGGTGTEGSNGIQVDANGFVYTTGYFSGTMDVDPNPGVTSITATGPKDAFVWKLNSSGMLAWGKKFGGPSSFTQGNDLALDPAGVVMVIGQFTNTCDFDPSTTASNLISAGGYEGYLCVLDAAGNYLNAVTLGGTGNDYLEKIERDNIGNMYITGYFENTADFDPSSGVYNLTSSGFQDAVIIKLNPMGSFSWARKFGGAWVDYGLSVDVDTDGNVYTGGTFGQTVDFDPGAGVDTLVSFGGNDAFVAILDSAGNYMDALQIGSTTGQEHVRSVNIGPGNVMHIAGYIQGTSDLNPYSGNYVVGSTGQDGFLVRLGACISTASAIVEFACHSYTAPDGHQYNTSGIYTATIPNSVGCDSVITINLTIDTVIASEVNNSPILSVIGAQQSSTYQWVDCNNNYAAIPGAVNQQFIASANGSYAAIVNNGNCQDTSSCMTVLNTGTVLIAPEANFTLFPNPAQDQIKISLPSQSIIRITDIAGRIISTSQIGSDGIVSIGHLTTGSYFITDLRSGHVQKLVKE